MTSSNDATCEKPDNAVILISMCVCILTYLYGFTAGVRNLCTLPSSTPKKVVVIIDMLSSVWGLPYVIVDGLSGYFCAPQWLHHLLLLVVSILGVLKIAVGLAKQRRDKIFARERQQHDEENNAFHLDDMNSLTQRNQELEQQYADLLASVNARAGQS